MCVCVCACVCPARVATPIFGGLMHPPLRSLDHKPQPLNHLTNAPCPLVLSAQAVEDLCIHRLGQNLYSKLTEECEAHIQALLLKSTPCSDFIL
jgi:hypothetical protein